ncbi:MAG: hypothetical protein L0229_14155 [Blastocatellia bacterium]|nr:hypothetical protein [Blastocatellia bacterium]
MFNSLLSIILSLSALTSIANQIPSPDEWEDANAKVSRLPPKSFPQLPETIIRYLDRRGCSIPQPWNSSVSINVIKGEFTRKGQTDWAVLCSKNRVSSILVFRGGSTRSVSEIAKLQDQMYLQTIDEKGTIGFSRAIGVVGRDYIIEHHERYGGSKPPPITHQGINDIFIEKASTVHYYHRGEWLKLKGAD